MFYGVTSGQLTILKRLFQVDIPVIASASGETLLMAAARSTGPQMVRFLVANADAVELDIQAQDVNGENALFYAAANADWQVSPKASKRGADGQKLQEGTAKASSNNATLAARMLSNDATVAAEVAFK